MLRSAAHSWRLAIPMCLAAASLSMGSHLAQAQSAFPPGHLYFASNSNGTVFDISAGGSFASAAPVATNMGTNLGQLAFSLDRTNLFGTVWSSGPVKVATPGGIGSTYVASLNSVLGLCRTKDNRLLVTQRGTPSAVFDITNPAAPTLVANIPDPVRNMTQLPTGEILVMGEQARIWRVDTGTATVWATVAGATLGGDIDYTSDGRVFASFWSTGSGIWEVTGGGNISAPRFVTPANSAAPFGVAIDRRSNTIYAAGLGTNYVLDVTGGGTFDFGNVAGNPAGKVFARDLPTTHDMALDFSPFELKPSVTVTAAANVTRTSADLSGTVNPNGTETTAIFQTRVAPAAFSASGSVAAGQNPIPPGTQPVAVSATKTGLLPGTTYDFNILATNSGGVSQSTNGTFTTLPNQDPVAEAGGPYLVLDQDSLNLNASASADPEGDQIVSYEWDFNNDGTIDLSSNTATAVLTYVMRQEFGQVKADRHMARLRVTDSFGGSDEVDFEIEVGFRDPQFAVVASRGGLVPGAGVTGSGIPADSVWKTFGVPSVNSAGSAAFFAATTSPTGVLTQLYVLASPDAQPAPIATAKRQAPGLATGVLFSGFKDPLLNERGDIAFLASLTGTGVNSTSNQALFVLSTDGDGDRVVARKGAEPEGVPGAQWKNFNSVAFANESAEGGAWTLAISASMTTGPRGAEGPGNVTKSNDTGLWLADSHQTQLALREGQLLEVGGTGKTVKSFYALKPLNGGAGQGFGVTAAGVPVQVIFTDRTQALLRVSLSDLAVGHVQIDTLALSGDVIPDGGPLPTLAASGVPIKTLGVPAQNSTGDTTVWISNLDSKLNAQGVVRAGNEGPLEFVARKGDVLGEALNAPTFSSFTSVEVNAEHDYAILAKLAGGTVTKANDVALVRRVDGQDWEIVAQEGNRPPGTPEGALWSGFASYSLGDAGSALAFVGKLRVPKAGEPNPAGITTANDTGVWFALPGEAPRLILREGDTLGEKTVRSFAALTAISGSPAQRRTFAADGSVLLIRVIATDGSQHVLHITLPAAGPVIAL